jgi:glyoxylase-like metal-dependent hydrolase (beta-lactamase superfamily II)
MSTIKGTTIVDRPVDTVFDFLADPRNEPSYNPAILTADKLTSGPIGVGTRFRQRVRALGGVGDVDIEVVEHRRPRQLAWQIRSSGMDVRGDLDFRSGPQQTTVHWTWRFVPLGRLRVLGPLVTAAGTRLERDVWRRLKRHLEEDLAWEAAPGVLCLGPSGRTRTNVFFVRAGAGWVLVDTGFAGDADRIRRAAAAVFGEEHSPYAIVLTHAHPDHSGAALELARGWGCQVYLHADELPVALGDLDGMWANAGPLDRWVVLPTMRAMSRRRRTAVLARGSLAGRASTLHPGEPVPYLFDWQCIATPGHTPGHVALWRPTDGVLITGDALVTVELNRVARLLRPGLSEPPWYTTWNGRAARASIRDLAALAPDTVLPGHGAPLVGPGTAEQVRLFATGMRA